MARKTTLLLLGAPALAGLVMLVACGDDDNATSTPDAGGDAAPIPPPNPPPPPPPPGDDGGDGGDGATEIHPSVIGTFDPLQFQLAEGLTVGANDAGPGPVDITWAPLGKVETVATDGGTTDFATVPGASNTYTLGIAFDSIGNLYAAVAAAGASPTPNPGVYKYPPAGGGGPTTYGIGSALVPAMAFPNGLDFVGDDLYVADSATAVVYKIPSGGGLIEVYASGALLAGDAAACGGSGNGFPIGANGIIHDDQNFYVANTDKGIILKIPRGFDGGLGDAGSATPTVVVQDCQLAGADGIAFASNGDILIANNYKSKIQRVAKTGGAITTVSQGAPLDGPASLWVDKTGGQNRLLITNSAFASTTKYSALLAAAIDAGGDAAAFDAGFTPNPALLSMPLP